MVTPPECLLGEVPDYTFLRLLASHPSFSTRPIHPNQFDDAAYTPFLLAKHGGGQKSWSKAGAPRRYPA
jgi:hypothetical protein